MNEPSTASEALSRLAELSRTHSSDGLAESVLIRQLATHPQEVVDWVLDRGLGKYDSALCVLLETIGAPAAAPCALRLVEASSDLNWPVYPSAASALISLGREAVFDCILVCVLSGRTEDLFTLAYEIRLRAPDWRAGIVVSSQDWISRLTERQRDALTVFLNEVVCEPDSHDSSETPN